jgi:hypothetical protein
MTAPLHVAVWAPPLYLPSAGPGVRTVSLCCRRHGPSQRLPEHELLLGYVILKALLALPEVAAACAAGTDLIMWAAQQSGPLCCVLGDARMEALHRQIPAVWALRN